MTIDPEPQTQRWSRHGPPMTPAAPSSPADPAPAARGGVRRWLLPAAVALVLGLGVGTGIGMASTSGERADLKDQNRELKAQSAELTEQLTSAEEARKTAQANLLAANADLAVCRASGAASRALVETAEQLEIAGQEYGLADVGSKAEREAERKLDALSIQLQQKIGVAKDRSESCAAAGGARS